MRTLLIVLLSTIYLVDFVTAQKEDYIWVGGRDRQVSNEIKNGVIIDFNESGAKFESGIIGHNFHSYSASICDEDGRLLFYTNGCAILDSTGSVVENGDSLNYNEWFEERWQGNCKRNGYPGTQDIIILPYDAEGFAIISKVKTYNGFAERDSMSMHISRVAIDENMVTKVIVKDSLLYSRGDLSTGYLTAIKALGGSGFYLLQPKVEDSVFVTYYLSENGIQRLVDQNTHHFFSKERSSASGTARFSPDGSKYAFYNYHDGLHLYDFDLVS